MTRQVKCLNKILRGSNNILDNSVIASCVTMMLDVYRYTVLMSSGCWSISEFHGSFEVVNKKNDFEDGWITIRSQRKRRFTRVTRAVVVITYNFR